MRRREAVRWGPAATAQLSRRQRRKSTGTSGRPEGPGRAAGAGARARASARQRPAVGGDQRVVGAGVGQARAAGEPLADRARQAAARVDLAAGGDGGDRGQQQQGDERRQARLLDARRSPLPLFPVSHRPDARAPTTHGWRAKSQNSVPAVSRVCLHWGHGGQPLQPLRRPRRVPCPHGGALGADAVLPARRLGRQRDQAGGRDDRRLDQPARPHRHRRRAGDAGPRRDPRPLPGVRHSGARGARRSCPSAG